MKTLFSMLATLTLMSSVSDASTDGRFGTQGVFYSFAMDYRPVDGHYVRVTIYSPDRVNYSVVRNTISARGGIKNQKTIVSNIACQVKNPDTKDIRILCKKDLRPVDGKLQVVAIVPSRYGSGKSFDAKYYVSFYDRINGKVVKNRSSLGMKLKRIK